MTVATGFDVDAALSLALQRVPTMPPRGRGARTSDPVSSVKAAAVATPKALAHATRYVRALAAIGAPASRDQTAEVMIALQGRAESKRMWRSEMRVSTELLDGEILVVVGREDGQELLWFPGDPSHPVIDRYARTSDEEADWPDAGDGWEERVGEWGDGE